jgi:hypothetical protein
MLISMGTGGRRSIERGKAMNDEPNKEQHERDAPSGPAPEPTTSRALVFILLTFVVLIGLLVVSRLLLKN